MNILNTIFSTNFLVDFEFSTVDTVFFVAFFGILLLFLIILLVQFIKNKRTSKVIKEEINKMNGGLIGDNHLAKVNLDDKKEEATEKPRVEARTISEPNNTEVVDDVLETTTEEPKSNVEVEEVFVEENVEEIQPVCETVVEETTEEVVEPIEEVLETVDETSVVEETVAEPVVDETPVVEEVVEETTEEVIEEPVVEEVPTFEEVVEETVTEPVVEETQTVEPEVVEETTEEAIKHGREYNGKYEVYKDNDFYRYRLKASNGEILLVSEIYSTYKSCITSIEALKRNLVKGKAVIIVDKRKNYKFKIVAANHRVIAISANYVTEARAQSALESFKRFALTNDIVDVELPAEELDSTLVLIEKIKDEDKRGGRFIIKKDVNGEYTWELKPNNGEILCQSGGYCTRSSVESSIMAFKEVVKTGKFYIYTDKNNNYQFKLYSRLGRLYMVGESYSTSQAVESAVKSILNFIDMAVIQDKTSATPAKKATKSTSSKK